MTAPHTSGCHRIFMVWTIAETTPVKSKRAMARLMSGGTPKRWLTMKIRMIINSACILTVTILSRVGFLFISIP